MDRGRMYSEFASQGALALSVRHAEADVLNLLAGQLGAIVRFAWMREGSAPVLAIHIDNVRVPISEEQMSIRIERRVRIGPAARRVVAVVEDAHAFRDRTVS
jgi:hypothetical protein